MTRVVAAASFLSCVLAASTASASRVAVGSIRGPGSEQVRGSLEDALRRSGHEVVERTEVDAAPAPLRAEAVDADFVLTGRVRRAGGAWAADLRLEHEGSRGSRRVRMRGDDPELLADRVVAYLEERIDGFEPTEVAPAPPPPAPVAPPPPTPAPPPERVEAEEPEPVERQEDRYGFLRRNVLDLETSIGILSRSLSFRDDLFSRTRGYELGAAPALVLRSQLYPFARTDVRGLRDIGVETNAEYALVADSQRPDGQVYPTSASAWSTGLVYRVPLGPHELQAGISYAVQSFLIDPAGPATPTNDPRPELPRVRYQAMRSGIGARVVPVAGLVLYLRASYVAVFDAGGIESDVWFPNAHTTALDAIGGVGYRLHPALELRAAVQYRRYGLDLRPQLGDPIIAGGALDQYWLYTLGIAVMR